MKLEMWVTETRLNLSDFERAAAARPESDGLERTVTLAVFERVAAARLCELAMAVILNLGGSERVVAGLWELGRQAAAAVRLSVHGVVRTEAVIEEEIEGIARLETGVARRRRKTTRRRVSWAHAAGGNGCQC